MYLNLHLESRDRLKQALSISHLTESLEAKRTLITKCLRLGKHEIHTIHGTGIFIYMKTIEINQSCR